jgi:hypothetical protein
MKNLVKLGVAGALALGGSMAAHATITVPTSSGTTGDVVLWADVFNGSTLVKAYVGDTGITVDSAGGGTMPTGTFTNTNLNSLLSMVTGTNTIYWVLEGGDGHAGPSPFLVSSNNPTNAAAQFPFGVQSGSTLTNFGTGFAATLTDIVNPLVGTGSSALANSDGGSTTNGTGFNPFATAADTANWQGNSHTNVSTEGLGTGATFYVLSAANQQAGTIPTITALYTATLTASGLTFSPLSAVPLPAALWLLGSGLLGLAGVARRKVIAAA